MSKIFLMFSNYSLNSPKLKNIVYMGSVETYFKNIYGSHGTDIGYRVIGMQEHYFLRFLTILLL